MKLEDFDFDVPEELIAKFPLKNRTDARLLIGKGLLDDKFNNLINYLNPGDVLVLNDTKVLPARLFATKSTGGKIEVLVDRIVNQNFARAMIKASRAPKINDEIIFSNGSAAKVLAKEEAFYELEFTDNIFELTAEIGNIPLPPYLRRKTISSDKEDYQSVFAKNLGAVAAPTASLHFDKDLLRRIKDKNVNIAYLTLHVGSGTFLPVKTSNILEHKMHKEYFNINKKDLDIILDAKQKGFKVVAVGTTVVRTLETIALNSFTQLSGESDIFIYPGFNFKMVDRLITNFHLPKSTLMMLVSAFSGRGNIKKIYQHAIKEQYRFFSYGDTMILDKE